MKQKLKQKQFLLEVELIRKCIFLKIKQILTNNGIILKSFLFI